MSENDPWLREVPEALQHPENHGRFACAAAGLILSLLSVTGGYFAAPDQSMLFKLCDPHNPQIIVPISILTIFFWGLFICLHRRHRIQAIEEVSQSSLNVAAANILVQQNLDALAQRLNESQCEFSPLLCRLKAVVAQWRLKPGIVEADLVLQQFVSDDQDSTRRAFTLVRTFIWGLPVLGLIGTVLGIAFAVSGFANLLGGQVDDVDTIKSSLVGVTGGLSFAFLLTLMGLSTSLILMLLASSLEAWEERLYQEIQQNIVGTFLPVLQKRCPDSPPPQSTDALTHLAEAALDHIAKTAENHLNTVAAQLQIWQDHIASWGNSLQNQAHEAATELTHATKAAADLHRQQTAANQAVAIQLQKVAQEQAQAVTLHATNIIKSLQEINDSTRKTAEVQIQVHDAVQQLHDLQLVSTLQSFRDALTRHANLVDKLNTGLKITIAD